MSENHLEIIRVTEPDIIQEIGRLRADVWLAEGKLLESKVANGIWVDELDHHDGTTQYAVLFQGEVVAAARLSQHFTVEEMPYADEFAPYDLQLKVPYAYISRLVVRKDFRGYGLARRFDLLRIHKAVEQGANAVLALPLPYRIDSLKKLGFVYFGVSGLEAGEVDESGLCVPAHVMVHYLKDLPPFEAITRETT